MLNIAICEDDRNFIQIFKLKLETLLTVKNYKFNIDRFLDGNLLLDEVKNGKERYDIIFLDIDMPSLNGLDTARLLREIDGKFILVFLTSLNEEVYKVFEYDTFRFLRKSNYEDEIEEVLEAIDKRLLEDNSRYDFKTKDGIVKLSALEHIVVDHKQRYIQFIEPNFLHDFNRAIELMDLVKGLSEKVTFDFACRIDSLIENKELIYKIKDSGAVRLLLGVESFYDLTLKKWHKDIKSEQIIEAILLLKNLKLGFTISLILFHPDVTKEELITNLSIISKYNLYNYIDDLYNYLRLIPGTSLNPKTNLERWSFKEKEIEKIYKDCMRYKENEKNVLYKVEVNSLNINTLSVKEQLKRNLLRVSNLKKSRYEYLEHMLVDFEKNETIHEDIVFKFNCENIINYLSDKNIYEIINFNTGLKYHVNENIIKFIKEFEDSSFEELYIWLSEKNQTNSTEMAEGAILILKELIENNIIKCEVIHSDICG